MGRLVSLISPSPREAFAERRRRLLALRGASAPPLVLSAGWARARNFAHNVFPFRAESHFLYLVGHQIEGALLVLKEGEFFLALPDAEPELVVWNGTVPSHAEWEQSLGLSVRPYSSVEQMADAAVLPPQDDETAAWLTELLGREVYAQTGPDLEGPDADLAEQMIALRLCHDSYAAEQLRRAAAASAEAHLAGMRATRGATHESQVRGAMEGALVSAGLRPGYTSIVTTHGEVLHAPRSDRSLERGELLLCDVGGETEEGFTGDITRTWPVSGAFSPTQRALYEAVLSVQESAISKVRPSKSYLELHQEAALELGQALVDLKILIGKVDDLFASGAIGVFFPHGLGHLLGLDVHDMEDLGDRAGYEPGQTRSSHPSLAALRLNRTLKAGMCVTIEPGFYQIPMLKERAQQDKQVRQQINWSELAKFDDVRGIRIEDDVLVTEQGSEVLSEGAPKDVAVLEEVLRR